LIGSTINWYWQARRLRRAYPKSARYPLALVSVREQRLYLISGLHLCGRYPVSTSRYGIGAIQDSYQTPHGVHRVAAKIGDGQAVFRLFKARRPSAELATANRYATISRGDAICTRILWLAGLEAGVNRGGYRDSQKRFIYLHGTVDEKHIGRPASSGCIRMKNHDVIEVFNTLQQNSIVYIVPPQ